ncbi:MAG: hypothetical protein R2874_17460 [Desulfobacterales bacterium]
MMTISGEKVDANIYRKTPVNSDLLQIFQAEMPVSNPTGWKAGRDRRLIFLFNTQFLADIVPVKFHGFWPRHSRTPPSLWWFCPV